MALGGGVILRLEIEEEMQILIPKEGGGGADSEDEGSGSGADVLALSQLSVQVGHHGLEGRRMQNAGDVEIAGVEIVVI